jgi:hypothetical protein
MRIGALACVVALALAGCAASRPLPDDEPLAPTGCARICQAAADEHRSDADFGSCQCNWKAPMRPRTQRTEPAFAVAWMITDALLSVLFRR